MADSQIPPGTQGVTLQNAAVANGNGIAADIGGLSSYVFQVSGTLSGATTVNFEASMDGGTTWHAIQVIKTSTGAVSTTTVATGAFYASMAGWNAVRARISNYGGADSVTVKGRGSLASAGVILESSSGGGATGSVNVAQVGGTATDTNNGTASAGTLRVTVASDSTGQIKLAAGSATIGALTANQSVNVAQINGVAPTMGNGVAGTGVQRVTLASDSTGQVALATGSNTIGALTADQTVDVNKIAGTATAAGSGAITAGTQRVTIATDDTLKLAQNSTTSGQVGILAQGAVTTASPSYTTAKTQPLSLDTFGSLRVGTQAQATYGASTTELSLAANATDIFTLTGSGTKTVFVTRVQLSGIATAAGSVSILLIKRSTADSAGTSTTEAITPYDSSNSAATAVVKSYTANPTLGTAVGTIQSRTVSFTTAASSAIAEVPMVILFGAAPEQNLTLRGTTEQLCVNLNGVTVTGGKANIDITWVEF